MRVPLSSLFFNSFCKANGVYTVGQGCNRAGLVSKKCSHPTGSSALRWITSGSNPIPFLDNKARSFKIDDVYKVDSKSLKRQRFALPLGLSLFGVIMFFAFYGGDYEKYVQFWKIEASEPAINSGAGESSGQSIQLIPDENKKK